MKKPASKAGKLISLMIIAVFMLSCSIYSRGAKKDIAVRIGCFPNITHTQALIGKLQGRFEKALGRVEWRVFNAGPSEIEALFAKALDIAYIGPGPAINGFVKSKGDLKIIAGAADAGAILICRKNLNLKTIKDLSGKRVAVPQFGNTQDLLLRYLLRKNGLKDTTRGGSVEIRQVANPDVKLLLDRGDIDAAIVPEPWGSRLIREIGARVVLDYNELWMDGRYTTAVVVARTEFIEKHPELVAKFLAVHVELTDYINKQPETARKIANRAIDDLTGKPLSDEVLKDAYQRIIITYDPEKSSVVAFAKLMEETGMFKRALDIGGIFAMGPLNKVLQQKGIKGNY